MKTQDFLLSEVPLPAKVNPPVSGSSNINVGTTERILSVAGGSLLAAIGLRRFSPAGILMALSGGALLFRGTTGYCPINASVNRDSAHSGIVPINIIKTVTINKPRSEVYQFWRKLENLPLFMKHLFEVKEISNKKSHWTAKVPGKLGKISWESEIVKEVENIVLMWKSTSDALVDNSGEVRFNDAPGNRGTEVQVAISYLPPGGDIGKGLAGMLNNTFGQIIKEDIRRFKQFIETGEIATIEGQTSGRLKIKKIKKQKESKKKSEKTLAYESIML